MQAWVRGASQMTDLEARAKALETRILAAIVDDQRVPVADLWTPEEAVLRVRAATRSLDWAMAAMPAHQLEHVGMYLRWLLDQDPVQSDPLYEPQRIVLGLLLLALRDILRGQRESEIATEQLTPTWYRDAVRSVA